MTGLPDSLPSPLLAVVADDEPDVRLLLKLQLRTAGVDVVAEASNGEEAVEAVILHRPHVVVMDLLMPKMTGFEAIPIVQERAPDTKIIAYSAVAGEFVRNEMARLDVPLRLKDGDIGPLLRTIEDVLSPAPT